MARRAQGNEMQSLSDVLDQLEASLEGDETSVESIVGHLGQNSFAALLLTFSLISTSPASAIPWITAMVAVVVFLLIIQMILKRDSVWLPSFIMRRHLSTKRLCKGIAWLRKPAIFVERLLKPRLDFILHMPWLLLPLFLILALALFMPFMEVIPTSGSIASAVIAFFAAGLLARDGRVVLTATVLLLIVPIAVWYFWPS